MPQSSNDCLATRGGCLGRRYKKKPDVNMRATEFQSIIDSARRALRAAHSAQDICHAAAEHFAAEVGVLEACVQHMESKLPFRFRHPFVDAD